MAHKKCKNMDTLHLLIKDCGKGDNIPGSKKNFWKCLYQCHFKNVVFIGQVISGNAAVGFEIIDPYDSSKIIVLLKSSTVLVKSKNKPTYKRNDLIYENVDANFYLHENDYIFFLGAIVNQPKRAFAYKLEIIDKNKFDEIYEYISKKYANEYGVPDAIENDRNLLKILEQVEAQLCNEPRRTPLKTKNCSNEKFVVTNTIASNVQHSKSSINEKFQKIKKPRYDELPSTSAIITSNQNDFISIIEQNDHKTDNHQPKMDLDPVIISKEIQSKKIDISALDELIPDDLLAISQVTEIIDYDFPDFTLQQTQTVDCKKEIITDNRFDNKNERTVMNHLKIQTENLNIQKQQKTNMTHLFGTVQNKVPENSLSPRKGYWQHMNIFKIQKTAKRFDEVTFAGIVLSVEESIYEEDKRIIVVADIQGSISCSILSDICFSGEPSCIMPGRLNCQFEPTNAKFPHKSHICIGYKVRVFGVVFTQRSPQKLIKVTELRHLNDADAKEFDNNYISRNQLATEQINDIEVLRSGNPFLKTPFRAYIRELHKAECIEKHNSLFGFVFNLVEIVGTVAHIACMNRQECTKCTYQFNVNDGTSIIACEFCVEERLFINQYHCELPIEDLTFNDTVRVQGLLVNNCETKCILVNVLELLDKASVKEPNWQGVETYLDKQKFYRYDYFGVQKKEKTREKKKYEKMSLFNSWNGTIVNKKMENQKVQHNSIEGKIENNLFSEFAIESEPRQRRNSWSNKTDISSVKKKVASSAQINCKDVREELLNESCAEILKAKSFKGHEKLSSTQMMQLYVFHQSEEMKCNDIPHRHGWRTFWNNFKRDQELVKNTVVLSEKRQISDFEVKWKQMLEQLYKEIYLPRINLINSFRNGIFNVKIDYKTANTKEMVCAPKRNNHTCFYLPDFADYNQIMESLDLKI